MEVNLILVSRGYLCMPQLPSSQLRLKMTAYLEIGELFKKRKKKSMGKEEENFKIPLFPLEILGSVVVLDGKKYSRIIKSLLGQVFCICYLEFKFTILSL